MDTGECPPDSVLVEVFFEEGPLGVTLHRKQEGTVIVYEIIDGSQAVNMDLIDGDELWCVGDRMIGDSPIDKVLWSELVDYIRKSDRPLRIVFRRHLYAAATAGRENREISGASSISPVSAFLAGESNSSRCTTPADRAYSTDLPSNLYRAHSDSGNDMTPPGGPSSSPNSRPHSQSLISHPSITEAADESAEHGSPNGSSKHVLPELENEDDDDDDIEDEDSQLKTLASVASTLVFKEKEKGGGGIAGFFGLRTSEKQPAQSAHDVLVRPGRYMLRSGCMLTDSKTSKWNSNSLQPKQFYLFNDILIVATPTNSNFQVDVLIDLHMCKFANGCVCWLLVDDATEQAVSKASSANNGLSPEMLECSFALLSPVGLLRVVAKSANDKNVWLKDLERAVSSCFGPEERVIGWRHQFMLGTLHSAVLSRDECKVRELLLFMEGGNANYMSIDDLDGDGYTALHYACMFKAHGIIRALIQSGADSTVVDRRGFSAIHWSSLMLDDYALSVLLNGIFCADLTDSMGCTPLFLACIEGRDANGKADPVALRGCVSALLGANSSPMERSDAGIPIIFYVTSAWQTEAASVFLSSGLIDIHDRAGERNGYLIHTCMEAKSLRKQVGLATVIRSEKQISSPKKQKIGSPTNSKRYTLGLDMDGPSETLIYANGTRTLSLLLQYGSRPNARDASGRSPLHLLAEKEINWGVYCQEALLLLIEAGARMDDSPQCQNLRTRFSGRTESSKGTIDEAVERRNLLPALNIDPLDPAFYKLDGSEASKVCYPLDGKEKCVMCSINFTLFRRQHHCRLCNCLCCDECSRKRVTMASSQVTETYFVKHAL
jgi:ankyrin repeat protein